MSKYAVFFGGLLFGGLAGVAIGMLTAPKSGEEIRNQIADVSDDLYRKAAYEIEELADKIDDVRNRVEDLKNKTGMQTAS